MKRKGFMNINRTSGAGWETLTCITLMLSRSQEQTGVVLAKCLKILAENFSDLADLNLQLQEAQQTTSRKISKQSIPDSL
jgi:exosome complex RNA-binding protein Csl4